MLALLLRGLATMLLMPCHLLPLLCAPADLSPAQSPGASEGSSEGQGIADTSAPPLPDSFASKARVLHGFLVTANQRSSCRVPYSWCSKPHIPILADVMQGLCKLMAAPFLSDMLPRRSCMFNQQHAGSSTSLDGSDSASQGIYKT